MNKLKALFLIIEVILGYCIPIYFLILGTLMGWIFVAGLFYAEKNSVLVVSALIFGWYGVAGVSKLLMKIISPEKHNINARRVTIHLALGVVGVIAGSHLIGGMERDIPIFTLIILVPPILVTLHLFYLGRGYLWQNN
jgi:hypothetical protein|tara:strand:+ start:847 stop:1260 length:414 start_codon:yes stop_codon:yes gene_type:complete